MRLKITIGAILISLFALACGSHGASEKLDQEVLRKEKYAIAYVTSWTSIIPKVDYITHINYAFGHVSNSFDGVRIDNESRLKQIVALKNQKESLKVLLSIGGWGSGNFSEMASDATKRKAFAEDCKRVVDEFKLNGIDIDWEYPTSSMAGISSSPADKENFSLLMKEIREAIGTSHLLTIATAASGEYFDFNTCIEYLDFVNIMSYDMGRAPKYHHASLYESDFTEDLWTDKAVKAHYTAGIPMEKLVMGVPFYGKTAEGSDLKSNYGNIVKLGDNYIAKWDSKGQVPYIVDKAGVFICGYDNPESIAIKAQYVLDNDMLGIMYWEYAGDDEQGALQKAVYTNLNKK